MDIQHQESESKGKFYIEEDGTQKGEITYSKMEDNGIIIDHTEVLKKFRNNNIGTKLVEHAVDYARQNDLKVVPTCPFAKSVIQRDESLQDVLKK